MELLRPPFAVVPWSPFVTGQAETVLATIWAQLHEEDLYGIVFHENPDLTFSQFMQFFSKPDVAPQILVEMVNAEKKTESIAGMTWLSSIETLASGVRRAVGSFAFFKKYWSPQWTTTFGEMVLDYWFSPEGLAVDLLTAVTPEPNRAARLYAKRLGIPYVARIDNYSSFARKPCAVHVAVLDRDQYQARRWQRQALEKAEV